MPHDYVYFYVLFGYLKKGMTEMHGHLIAKTIEPIKTCLRNMHHKCLCFKCVNVHFSFMISGW